MARKSNAGRKSKYFTNVEPKLTCVEGWAREGLIDEQIAKNLGISKDAFYKYKRLHEEFADALKKGKEIVDFEVENALLKRALGYEVEETTIEISEKDGEKVKKVKKHIPPDVTAQIYWLKNRKPLKWRDKPEMNANSNGGNIIFNIQPASTRPKEDDKEDD